MIYLLFIIFIGYNNIGKEGAKDISEALKINQTLQNLDLREIIYLIYLLFILFIGNNDIGKEGAKDISEALKINQTLQNLNLCKIII